MSISTNAGLNAELSSTARAAVEAEDTNQGRTQDATARARASAARREKPKVALLPLEAQSEIAVDMGGGETKAFAGVALDFEFEEPEYDASIPSLAPYIVGNVWEECTWWPFKGPGVRGGLKPRLGPKAWEAILESGMYCMRCLQRHETPHPEKCLGCDLTHVHRERAMAWMEQQMHMTTGVAPNRETRRAMKRQKKSAGGVLLPG